MRGVYTKPKSSTQAKADTIFRKNEHYEQGTGRIMNKLSMLWVYL